MLAPDALIRATGRPSSKRRNLKLNVRNSKTVRNGLKNLFKKATSDQLVSNYRSRPLNQSDLSWPEELPEATQIDLDPRDLII